MIYSPFIEKVEWLGDNRVRLAFTHGRMREVELPIRSARRARPVSEGLGLDIGDGREYSARFLYAKGKRVR